jgi:hypothetical protein
VILAGLLKLGAVLALGGLIWLLYPRAFRDARHWL